MLFRWRWWCCSLELALSFLPQRDTERKDGDTSITLVSRPFLTSLLLSSIFVLLQFFSPLLFLLSLSSLLPSSPRFQRLACGYVVMEFDGWRLAAVLSGLWRNPSVTVCLWFGQTVQAGPLRWRYRAVLEMKTRGRGHRKTSGHDSDSYCDFVVTPCAGWLAWKCYGRD